MRRASTQQHGAPSRAARRASTFSAGGDAEDDANASARRSAVGRAAERPARRSDAAVAEIHEKMLERLQEHHRRLPLARQDGDGKVSRREFVKLMPLLLFRDGGASYDAETMGEVFDSLDADRSGFIEYNELRSTLRRGATVELAPEMYAGGAGEIEMESKNRVRAARWPSYAAPAAAAAAAAWNPRASGDGRRRRRRWRQRRSRTRACAAACRLQHPRPAAAWRR